MPQLRKSGNIFNLAAAAGFDEGYIGGDVKGNVGMNYDAMIGACHGVNLALHLEVLAKAEATLKLLWLIKGKAEGDASASIGVKINAQADLNVFDVLGFSGVAKGEVQATAGGTLSVNLDFEDLAKAARKLIKEDYAYDILIAFLNEVSIGAGISGRVNAGASACATLSVRGSLSDDTNSGFEVKYDFYAAFGVGGGYGMYAGIKLDSPKRFFLYASERTTQEIVGRIRQILPKEFYYLLEVVQFTLPVVLNSAYELAQLQIDSGVNPAEATTAFTNNFFSQLQRYLLDKIVAAGINKLSDAIKQQIDTIITDDIILGDNAEVKTSIDELINRLSSEGITSDNLNEVINDCINLFDAMGVISEEQKTAITITWLAFNTVEAIRNGFQRASASASANSFLTGQKMVREIFIELENPPQLVRDELSRITGTTVTTIDTVLAIDYILSSNIADELLARVPYLETILESLQICFGMTIGELIEATFNTDFEESITQNELYQRFKGLLKAFIENLIQDRLISELNKQAGKNEDVLRYIDEVVSPSCKTLTAFVFNRLDDFIINKGALDESFKNALTSITMNIFSSNVLIVADILLTHTIENTNKALRQLATDIENSPDHVMSIASVELFRPFIPKALTSVIHDAEQISVACREFAKNLCYAAADISGPMVYTVERMDLMRKSYKTLFNAFGPNTESPIIGDLEAFFQGVTNCTHVPSPIAAKDLAILQLDIIKSSLEILIPQVSNALAVFGLKLTETIVAGIEQEILKIFEDFETLLKNIRDGLQKLREEIQRFADAYNDAVTNTADALEVISDELRNDKSKALFLTTLKDLGKARLNGDATAIGAFLGACDLFAPVINIAIDGIAEFIKLNSNIFREAADTTLITDTLFALIPSTLPAEVALDDVKNAFMNLMDTLKPLISKAIELKEAEMAAERLNNDKKAEEEIRKQAQANYEKRKKLPKIKNIETEIISPVPFVSKKTEKILDWTYGKKLPVQIKIKGADITFLTTTPKGIFLAINGQEYQFDFSNWASEKSYLIYDAVLSTEFHPLQQGLNTIECTVVTPESVTKTTVACMMNPDLASDCTVIFDLEKSMINTGGDDHEYRQNESVAFTNIGNMPADVSKWILSDRINHFFILPENVVVMPHETLRIFTGYGIDSKDAIYQLKKRAIWNNTEDTVMLINKDRVLVLNQAYKLK